MLYSWQEVKRVVKRMDPDRHDAGSIQPTQLQRRVPRRPEHELMAAVLDDAVNCVRGAPTPLDYKGDRGRYAHLCGTALRRQQRAEAAKWFRSTERSWPFAFECICETLGLDPQAVRDAVLTVRAV